MEGGLNRPPMERTPAIAKLFQTARGFAKELGVTLQESSTGGGSDGNFTAALGVPTLDGLGGVGEGAHAANESILVDRIVGPHGSAWLCCSHGSDESRSANSAVVFFGGEHRA